jgi:hypothetical protein
MTAGLTVWVTGFDLALKFPVTLFPNEICSSGVLLPSHPCSGTVNIKRFDFSLTSVYQERNASFLVAKNISAPTSAVATARLKTKKEGFGSRVREGEFTAALWSGGPRGKAPTKLLSSCRR